MKTKTSLQLSLEVARATLAASKVEVKTLAAQVRAERLASKAAKVDKAAARREAAIAKAQAKLQKLLDKANPVGTKAIKASRKPGPVTVTKMA